MRPYTVLFLLVLTLTAAGELRAAKPAVKPAPRYSDSVPPPTLCNVAYGHHPRQVLDAWLARTPSPAPLVMVIHGGGWNGNSKEIVHRFVKVDKLLEAGISVAAINYRLVPQARAAGIRPPVKAPLQDAARAVQFIRSRARDWHIDPERIAASGGSAGACSSLWLAYHDDLADPNSPDPVARESTRLFCAAVVRPQTTLDPQQMREWIPNCRYGAHAFGLDSFDEFLARRDRLETWIREYSPYALVSPDDPPVYLSFSRKPAPGQAVPDPVHSANFGVKLRQRCQEVGISCELVHPGLEQVKWPDTTAYLVATLTGTPKDNPAR